VQYIIKRPKKSTMVTMDVDKLVEGSRPPSVATVSSIPPLKEIDELRYSRLIFTLGRAGMNSLSRSRVLVVGCKGLGAEVAKNLILSGVRVLGLVDDEVTCIADLGAQFLLTEADLGHNRAAATARKLKEFNPLADIVAVPSLGLENTVRNYTALVVTTGPMPFLIHLDSICRSHGVLFVAAISRGLFFSVFVDFGDTFLVSDDTGEPAGSILVEGITQEFPATVTVVEEQRHGLEDGDEVVLSGIKGMEELNRDAPYSVTVTGRHSFTIPVDSRPYGRYLSGGYFQKLKHERKLGFLSMENAIRSPEFCISDPVKSSRSLHLHVAFQAVDEFERRQCEQGSTLSPLSPSFKDEAVEEVLGLAREIWEQSGLGVRNSDCSNGFAVGEASEVVEEEGAIDGISPAERGVAESGLQEDGGESISSSALPTGSSLSGFPARMSGKRVSIDEDIVRHLAQGAHVELSPIAAIAGGIAAQEIMKGITGVFTPLKQWLYFDAIECLPMSIPLPEERALCRSRYDLQTSLFGRLFQEKLGSLQWLVVGAGGLGCEVLKNMVLMGVGCSPDGCITVTDMDVVSKPNLTDQLLYQLEDVDRPKTPTAARALRAINPGAQIHALQVCNQDRPLWFRA
jgi:molybdopterin/thiamine biosynthesis adenylyltransferase